MTKIIGSKGGAGQRSNTDPISTAAHHAQDGCNDSNGSTTSGGSDGVVTGTNGNDSMAPGYVDLDGDQIDGNDAILPGDVGDDDLILALDGDDTVDAGAGDDLVFGGAGVDLLAGGAGSDTLDGGADTDFLFGQDGADTLIGSGGSDAILGGADDDLIYGDKVLDDVTDSSGAFDVLFGQEGDDTLFGGDGDDLIDGGAGADVQIGGADQDTFFEVGVGDDIDGSETGVDFDTLVVSGPAVVTYDPNDAEAGTIEFFDLVTQTSIGTASFRNIENLVYVEEQSNPFPQLDGLSEDDAQVYTASAAAPTSGAGIVEGTNGEDLIDLAFTGDPEGDRIDANDAILPGQAPNDDIVRAGNGQDTVMAGLANDDVFGGNGDDDLYGESGDDTLRGENGQDLIIGGTGDDELSGGRGDDDLRGGDDNDILAGGQGNDLLDGGDGNDFLVGGKGNDQLSGGIGNDLLSGGKGNDTIDLGGDDDMDQAFGDADEDKFFGAGIGDTVDGGEAGNDFDTLDITQTISEVQAAGGSFVITYDPGNAENGVVTYFDANGGEIGTTTFYNIEKIEDAVPCFTPGTLIATPIGERRVEDLIVGDRVITRDNGIQDILWLGKRDVTVFELARAKHLRPVLIQQGALGAGLPERDMLVSPNHRVLVANDKTALYFEEREVLVAAKHLTGLNGVDVVETASVTYIHFMFEQHEVVLSDGAWTESFQPGDQTLLGIGNAQRTELFELFPELQTSEGVASYQSARRSLKKHEAKVLLN